MPLTIKKLTELKETGIINISILAVESNISIKTLHSKILRQTELTPNEVQALTNVLNNTAKHLKHLTR